MGMGKILSENRRLKILTLLLESGGPINTELLAIGVRRLGVPSDDDDIRADVQWLDRAGLTSSRTVKEFIVVTVTPDGQAVACGQKIRSGVALPGLS